MLIELSSGLFAAVDEADGPRVVSAGPWHASRAGRVVYARRTVRLGPGRWKKEYLHHFLTGWPFVDHRDGDGLNNTRANLRQATKTQNNVNAGPNSRNRSGFKGVSWHRQCGKWQAHIKVDGRSRYLGLFLDAADAARAYDAAAREAWGEFAHLNFKERTVA